VNGSLATGAVATERRPPETDAGAPSDVADDSDPRLVRILLYAAPGGDWAILRQQFLERLPIVLFPTGSQALRQALGKARMVKNELGA
jgi:hypothetical protein